MWERKLARKGELYIQMPGLVTGTLLEQVSQAHGDRVLACPRASGGLCMFW